MLKRYDMNKKILIGSVIAICILIGVSFTSVVGYNSVESNIEASPLFNIRSSRAIDEESEDFTCKYVGKGEEIALSIPEIDFEMTDIQEVIDSIKKMDDTTFNRFINFIIWKLQKGNEFKNMNRNEAIASLFQLRSHSQKIDVDFTWLNTPTLCWFPGCFILGVILVIGTLLFLYILKHSDIVSWPVWPNTCEC
jgi:hypothetical protein